MIGLLVALGGALGAVLRFVLDAEIKARLLDPSTFMRRMPWATFCINISGSFLLGLLSASHLDPKLSGLLATGVCGGFTTFSTASVETLTLMRERAAANAVTYALFTLFFCCCACAIGSALG